jgi:uncharacterized protein (TIGR02147 family)
MTATPAIENYTQYSKYLQDAYLARRSRDKKFSQRFINQKMGAQSSGWFGDILAGRKKLKLRHASPMAALFKLEPREQEFFRVLIALEVADSNEEKTIAYDQWLSLKGVSREKISRHRLKYFERWYYPALRELLILRSFKGTAAELGAGLHPPISSSQAAQALELLERLGLMQAGSTAPLPVLTMDVSTHTKVWDNIMKAYIELSLSALKKFDKKERDVSALTLPLSKEGLQKESEEIAALRKRLLALSEKDKANDRIYQCLFQVFPISRPVEVSHV